MALKQNVNKKIISLYNIMATRYRKGKRTGRKLSGRKRSVNKRSGLRRTLRRRGGKGLLDSTNPIGTGERAMEIVNKLSGR